MSIYEYEEELKKIDKELYTKQLEDNKYWRDSDYSNSLVAKIKAKSNHKGLDFNLDKLDLEVPTHCEVYGIPLARFGPLSHTPQLDRVIPELGYTKGNVRIISGLANRRKQDSHIEDLEKIIGYIKRNS